MSKPLVAYREKHGLSRADLAALLSDRLQRPIKEGGIKRFENYNELPKSWVAALGLENPEPPSASWGQTAPDLGWDGERNADEGTAVRDAEPPSMPPGGRSVPMQPPSSAVSSGGDYSGARARIAKAYQAIGAGVSMVSQNQGYAAVTDSYSKDIAQAWIAAAEHNQNVAKIVAFMESGGPVGELIVCHILLLGGFIYVSGRAPFIGSIVGSKFDSYHDAAYRHRLEDERLAQGVDASPPNGAENPLGNTARVTG